MDMKIWKRLTPDRIYLDAPIADKDEALRFIAAAFARLGVVPDAARLEAGLRERESVMSTGIGGGIGIPHTLSPDVQDASVLLIRPARPLPFDALDGLPVDIILGLVVPESDTSLHLQMLARISRLFRDSRFMATLRTCHQPELVLSAIRETEEQLEPR